VPPWESYNRTATTFAPITDSLLFAEQGNFSSEQGIGNSEPRRGSPRRFSPSADAIRFFAGNRFAKIAPTRSNPSVIPGLVRAYGRDFAV
jgi:hypothetical protein